MLNFESDYTEGAHPKILERLLKTNFFQTSGYGHDEFCEAAKEKIRAACKTPFAQIQFLSGGTQTNQIAISALTREYEGVLAAQSGHVNTHEAGAIEFAGKKILPLPQHEGKIFSCDLKNFASAFYKDENREHEVFPGLCYISQPTEYGTLYSKSELKSIYAACKKFGISLFVDGARLGYALAAKNADFTLADIAQNCDAFYIGGTKCGLLFGEALVFTKKNMPPHFENFVKKRGALLAKGRILGIQFDTLFSEGKSGELLYLEISRSAIEAADFLKSAFKKKGYEFFVDSPTNQIFPILENAKMKALSKKVKFSFWQKLDSKKIVTRFATSWATTKEGVQKLVSIL